MATTSSMTLKTVNGMGPHIVLLFLADHIAAQKLFQELKVPNAEEGNASASLHPMPENAAAYAAKSTILTSSRCVLADRVEAQKPFQELEMAHAEENNATASLHPMPAWAMKGHNELEDPDNSEPEAPHLVPLFLVDAVEAQLEVEVFDTKENNAIASLHRLPQWTLIQQCELNQQWSLIQYLKASNHHQQALSERLEK